MANLQAKDKAWRNFPSKKALKAAVHDGAAGDAIFKDTGIFPRLMGASFLRDGLRDGDVIVGPDAYTDRRWYARVVLVGGKPTIQ